MHSGLLLAAFVFAALFVNFRGDFALDDDWGYSTPIRWWMEGKGLHLTFWQSMPLVTQIGAGIAWSELFGFSQEALRVLTLAFALLLCLVTYDLGRSLGLSEQTALAACLLLPASPIFLALSFTFMTDVPGAALAFLSLALLVRYLKAGSGYLFRASAVVLLLAVLMRQTAIAVPLGLLLAGGRRRLVPALFLLGLSAGALLLLPVLLLHTTGLPGAYTAKSNALLDLLGRIAHGHLGALLPALRAALHLVGYLGLFSLPLAPVIARRPPPRLLFICLAGAVLAIAMGQSVLAGPLGNILTFDGIGPRIGDPTVLWPLSWGLTVIAFLQAGFVLEPVLRRLRSYDEITLLVLATAVLLYAPYALAFAALFDRYTLPSSILLVIVSAAALKPPDTRWAIATSLACFLLSCLLVQGYFEWQRNRQAILDYATGVMKIPREQIAAGFEPDNLAAIVSSSQEAHRMRLVDASHRPYRILPQPEGTVLRQSGGLFFSYISGPGKS